MGTTTQALRTGCELGFQQARENPEQTLAEYLAQIDHLQAQLVKLPSWKLRLLSNGGTWFDRFRLKVSRGEAND